MAIPCPATAARAPRTLACPRLVAAALIVCALPADSRALDARLHWQPSADARVQGYNVYVREATRPYGVARDAGFPPPAADGTMAWVLTGLSGGTTYFIALSAYTATRAESALSNEIALGTPDPCVQDACTSLTQCSVRPLPDGTDCGPPGPAACRATCLAGVCAGLAEHALTIDRLRLKRSDQQLRAVVSGRFTTSALFDPLLAGVQLTIADATGAPLVQAALAPADLFASGDGATIKALRRQHGAPVQVRRLVLRPRGAQTLLKAQVAAAPAPAALPARASVSFESGQLCLDTAPLDCQVRSRTLSCR